MWSHTGRGGRPCRTHRRNSSLSINKLRRHPISRHNRTILHYQPRSTSFLDGGPGLKRTSPEIANTNADSRPRCMPDQTVVSTLTAPTHPTKPCPTHEHAPANTSARLSVHSRTLVRGTAPALPQPRPRPRPLARGRVTNLRKRSRHRRGRMLAATPMVMTMSSWLPTPLTCPTRGSARVPLCRLRRSIPLPVGFVHRTSPLPNECTRVHMLTHTHSHTQHGRQQFNPQPEWRWRRHTAHGSQGSGMYT